MHRAARQMAGRDRQSETGETRDGWILQSKQFQAKSHTEEIFAHKLAVLCRHHAPERNANTL